MREIKDIRINLFDEDICREKDTELFIGDIALKFLTKCKPLYLVETDILRVRIHSDISNMKWEDKINGVNISRPKWYGNFSDTSTVFSLKLFHRLTDIMQLHYVVRIIYNLLLKLSVNLHIDTNINQLNTAYISCLKDNFIFSEKVFKEKNVEVVLCSIRYLRYTDYFLQFKNVTYFLTRKERTPIEVIQSYTLDEILSTPQFFNGMWIDEHQLLLVWGEEKYIFNSKTKNINVV